MSRCVLAAVSAFAAFVLAGPASAQSLRAFPPETLRAVIVFGAYPTVLLNGRPTELAPGSRVRDLNNMLVMPPTLPSSKMLVHYTRDVGTDRIKDVWILTADEAAIKPWPTTIEEARSWRYDQTARVWIKP